MTVVRRGLIRGALIVFILSALGLFGLVQGEDAPAWADEASDAQQAVDEAHTSLDAAEQQMHDIASDYDALKQEADSLQARIDESAAQALEAQQAVIEGRQSLGVAAVYEYRSGDSLQSLVNVLLDSTDFSDLMRNVTYLDTIMQHQSDKVAAQQERSQHFSNLVQELNDQKDAHQEKLSQLEAKKAEAEQVVAAASSHLSNAQDDQAARIAALQQAAEQLAAEEAVGQPVEVEEANTVDREPVAPPEEPVQPNPEPVPEAPATGGDEGGSESSDNVTGWSTGVASAYGGSTDPGTPNPGTTATGAVCDDNSMGVAVPMAWPNYWRYYGRTVEISYGGMTVLATVNDCGYMGGGSRSLDLQPGVWKAFGFSSCNDWGLRTVNYRFL